MWQDILARLRESQCFLGSPGVYARACCPARAYRPHRLIERPNQLPGTLVRRSLSPILLHLCDAVDHGLYAAIQQINLVSKTTGGLATPCLPGPRLGVMHESVPGLAGSQFLEMLSVLQRPEGGAHESVPSLASNALMLAE